MLPTETLSEAVAFLALYELDALLFASRRLSALAQKSVAGIRTFEFPSLRIAVYNGATVHNGVLLTPSRRVSVDHVWYWALIGPHILDIRPQSVDEFICDAFRNCTFDHLQIWTSDRSVHKAIRQVAPTCIIAGELYVSRMSKIGMQELCAIVESFRAIKV